MLRLREISGLDSSIFGGVPGPPGSPGVSVEGSVATYGDLPGSANDQDGYVVVADGLLYVYDDGWPTEGEGVPWRGPAGTTSVAWAAIEDKPAFIAAGTSQAEARTEIGAGTSSLALGTSGSTAKAGDYTPTWDEVSSKPAVIAAGADEATARSAIGAGTSSLELGTTSETAKAGDYQPASSDISDSTSTGRSVLTATDAAAARSAIEASNLILGTTSSTAKAGDYQPTWDQVSSKPAVIAAGADAAAARETIEAARAGKTVFVEDYRDGVRTDDEIITAAFAALESGGEIRFGPGVNYTTTSYLDFQVTSTPNILINGQGATITNTTLATGPLLRLKGTQYGSTVTELTAAVTSRSNTLTVASTDGYAAGDVIAIRSDAEPFNLDSSANFKQEMARVLAVPDSTHLTLSERTWNTYSISGYTVEVQQYHPMKHVVIKDLNIVGSYDPDNAQNGIWVQYFDGALISNCTMKGTTGTGITGQTGFNLTVKDCRAEDGEGTDTGVGVYGREVHNVRFYRNYGRKNRHTHDVDMCRDVLFDGAISEGDGSASLSIHGNCDVAKIANCTVRESGGGIIVRGKNTIVQGNHVLGSKLQSEQPIAHTYYHGITVGHGSPNPFGKGNGGIGLVVEDNYVDISGPAWTNEAASGIVVTASVVGGRIANNYIKGFPAHGIWLYGDDSNGAEIVGNRIDCSSQVGTGKHGIYIKPGNVVAANVQTAITIAGNNLPNGAQDSGIYVAGGSTSSPVTDAIRILDNKIGACGTTPINLNDGYYGSKITIHSNETEDVKAATLTVANFTVPPYIGVHGYGRVNRPLGVGQELGTRLRPGLYYGPTGSTSTTANTLDRLYAMPFFVSRRASLDRIGINVTTASGTGGSIARLGIYRDKEDGYGGFPGALVSGSTGSVATDAVAFVEATIDCTLDPGLYWLACVAQTAACTCTTYTGSNGMVGYDTAASSAGRGSYIQNTVTGTLPDPFAGTSTQGAAPYVQVRVTSTSTL